MTDTSGSSFGLGDLFGLIGGSNPLSGISTTVAMFQKGVYEFLAAVENFNEAMVQLNGIAARVNRLLDDVEPPVRALLPQLTRTIRAADAMAEQLSIPIELVAPGLTRLADALSSPSVADFPTGLGESIELFRDLARRMQPLGQMAESAGSLFGLRPLSALRAGGGRPTPAPPPPAPPAPSRPAPATTRAPATQSTAKRAAAKKTAARKTAARKAAAPSAAKKVAAKQSAAKKAATKQPAAKKQATARKR